MVYYQKHDVYRWPADREPGRELGREPEAIFPFEKIA